MFVNCNQALEIAKAEIKQTEAQRNIAYASWSDASLGQPVLVEDVFKAPSYLDCSSSDSGAGGWICEDNGNW